MAALLLRVALLFPLALLKCFLTVGRIGCGKGLLDGRRRRRAVPLSVPGGCRPDQEWRRRSRVLARSFDDREYYERMGDDAQRVAAWTVFRVTGEHRVAGGHRVNSVGE